MNLKPIIDEMRSYWIGGETGGQLLIGGAEAHYDTDKTPSMIIKDVKSVTCRARLLPIWLWEIEAEERSKLHWS